MMNTEEGEHLLPDGTKLYSKTWKPSTLPPRAILIFIHGFSDHINAYHELFPTLALRGIQTFGVDQRGWGRSVTSPASRGLTGPTTTVLADMTSLIEAQLKNNVDAIPVFLMGHSMGGAQVLQWIARGPDELKQQISGYLAESPFIAIHPDSQPARFTVIAGRLAARFLPKRQMIQKLDPNMMSRDQEICQQYDADTLCHDTGTLEGLAGMLQRAEELERGTVVIRDRTNLQIWVGHGSGDKVCSFDATQNFMSRLEVKEKDFRVYDGWYHKLHAEPGDDKITFANEVADWILARTTQITNQSAKIEGSQSKL